jgi:hypothetical protein
VVLPMLLPSPALEIVRSIEESSHRIAHPVYRGITLKTGTARTTVRDGSS